MAFHHGQEIICIFDWQQYAAQVPEPARSSIPVQWEVYHCAGYADLEFNGEAYIYLAEFPTWARYAESGFRPVQKNSMQVLRSLQVPVKTKEDA